MSSNIHSMSETAPELPLTEAGDHLAEVADAAHGGEVIYLTRDGRRWAAMVPVELAEEIEAAEDAEDRAALAAALAEGGEPVPWEQIKAELDL